MWRNIWVHCTAGDIFVWKQVTEHCLLVWYVIVMCVMCIVCSCDLVHWRDNLWGPNSNWTFKDELSLDPSVICSHLHHVFTTQGETETRRAPLVFLRLHHSSPSVQENTNHTFPLYSIEALSMLSWEYSFLLSIWGEETLSVLLFLTHAPSSSSLWVLTHISHQTDRKCLLCDLDGHWSITDQYMYFTVYCICGYVYNLLPAWTHYYMMMLFKCVTWGILCDVGNNCTRSH